MRRTSRSLRGAPSGFDGSNVSFPPKPVAAATLPGQFRDGHVPARADVQGPRFRVTLECDDRGAGKIVHVQELAPRGAGTPHYELARAFPLRVVHAPHEPRDHVRARGVEIVPGTVQVARHDRHEVAAVPPAVGLAQLDTGDLGDRVPLVGRLQRSGEQSLLRDRLRRPARPRSLRSRSPDCRRGTPPGGCRWRGFRRRAPPRARRRRAVRRRATPPSGGAGRVPAEARSASRIRARAVRGPTPRQPCRDGRRRTPAGPAAESPPSPCRRSRHVPAPGAHPARSTATISSTSASNVQAGRQPRIRRALPASPTSTSISVGRK